MSAEPTKPDAPVTSGRSTGGDAETMAGMAGNETGIPKDARFDAAGRRYYGMQFGSVAVMVIVTIELPFVTVTVPLFG